MKRVIINPVIKDVTTFIRTAAETGQQFTELEVKLSAAGGTPMHFHKNFSETFTVQDGRLGLALGKRKTVYLFPGETYTVPAGQLHRFFNPGQSRVRFNVLIEPGHTGFEQALYILYGLAGDGLTKASGVPSKLEHLAIIATMSDMHLPGPGRLMAPFFRLMAQRAKKKGTERLLIERYCQLYEKAG